MITSYTIKSAGMFTKVVFIFTFVWIVQLLCMSVITFFTSLMYFLLAAELLQIFEVLDLFTSGMFPPAYVNIFKIIQNLKEDKVKDGVLKGRVFVKL